MKSATGRASPDPPSRERRWWSGRGRRERQATRKPFVCNYILGSHDTMRNVKMLLSNRLHRPPTLAYSTVPLSLIISSSPWCMSFTVVLPSKLILPFPQFIPGPKPLLRRDLPSRECPQTQPTSAKTPSPKPQRPSERHHAAAWVLYWEESISNVRTGPYIYYLPPGETSFPLRPP